MTITVAPFEECIALVVAAARKGQPRHFHFVNAYTIALADESPEYAALLNGGVCFTDGVPVAWVGRRAYGVSSAQWPRVYGPDVMEAVLAVHLRHYLLGGTARTLQALQHAISVRWPSAEIVGAASPPFRALSPAEQREQDRAIRESGAQMVWVGLGTPKQDWEAARIAESAGLPVLAVGAAFDFIAKTKPQAPRWMQKSGTEWAFRLATEPRRLARRYLWGNPKFLRAAAKEPGLRRLR